MDRFYGPKGARRILVEYTVKDGETIEVNNVSRCLGSSISGDVDKAYIAYLSSGDSDYDVHLTSSREEFKQINNQYRAEEFMYGVFYTLQGIMMSFAFLFPFGVRWLCIPL